MSVSVQTMLDELREEMSSFEGSLPEISDREALDGLLGIKHVLLERWEVQERRAVEGLDPRSETPWEDAIFTVIAIGTVPLFILLAVVSAFSGAVVWTTMAGGLAVLVAATLLYHRWLAQPKIPPSDSIAVLATKKVQIDEDPIFLIDEVQAYVQEQIDTAHDRFSEIRTEFEKAVINPRQKAETTLVTLRQKRRDAQVGQFPDEDQILAQIDKYIAECERLLNPSFDEERVASQLRDTGEQLQALYKYPAQLEQVKAAYQSQADFVADLDDVGVDIDAIQSSRSSTMMEVASQLRDLRGEIGLTNRLLEGFGGYLASQPELQEALSTGGRVVDAESDDVGS